MTRTVPAFIGQSGKLIEVPEVQPNTFIYEGHTVVARWAHGRHPENWIIECDTCSVSFVTANAIKFMANNSVNELTVDGQEIRRIK